MLRHRCHKKFLTHGYIIEAEGGSRSNSFQNKTRFVIGLYFQLFVTDKRQSYNKKMDLE